MYLLIFSSCWTLNPSCIKKKKKYHYNFTFTCFPIFCQDVTNFTVTVSSATINSTLMHAAPILIRAGILHCTTENRDKHSLIQRCQSSGEHFWHSRVENCKLNDVKAEHVENVKSTLPPCTSTSCLYCSLCIAACVCMTCVSLSGIWGWEPSALQKLEEAVHSQQLQSKSIWKTVI